MKLTVIQGFVIATAVLMALPSALLAHWGERSLSPEQVIAGTCQPPLEFALVCGQEIFAGNDAEGSTDNIDSFPCAPTYDYSGPEIAYALVIDEATEVTVSLRALAEDLDLFILDAVGGECHSDFCFATSTNTGTEDESVTFQADPTVYFVVVDGYQGTVSDFFLSVDCALGVVFTDGFESGNLSAWSSSMP